MKVKIIEDIIIAIGAPDNITERLENKSVIKIEWRQVTLTCLDGGEHVRLIAIITYS